MRYLLFFLFFGLWSVHAQPRERLYVVLVSFDGFRHDYVSKFSLPNFQKFIKNGAASDGLIPAFPSKTFPNHYTLVTGLYPGNHGLVDNAFYDKKLGVRFVISNREVVENPIFYGGTPLWQLAQQQGLRTASCFWVGSEAPVQGEYPTYYTLYDHEFPNKKRIDSVMYWLALPEMERPHFITLYFSLVDSEGHATGPNSIELKNATLQADSLLGYLMERLNKSKLPINVILVSDHGMMELPQEEKTWVTLGHLFNTSDSSIILVNNGTHAHIYSAKADSLYTVLKKKEGKFVVYKKSMLPDRWHYNHERVGDLLIVANPGYQFRMVNRKQKSTAPFFGAHGFDPELKDMHGIFYAMGPNIQPGKRVPAFESIHVYPFITKLLKLQAPKVDGASSVLERFYRK